MRARLKQHEELDQTYIFQSGNVFHVSELRTCESFPEALNDVTLIEKLSSKTR